MVSVRQDCDYSGWEKSNIECSGSTKADLDGDGNEETIEITSMQGKYEPAFGINFYPGVTVKVNDSEITIPAKGDFYPTDSSKYPGKMSGYIVDINNMDGEKEICLYFESLNETWFQTKGVIITYENGKLNEIDMGVVFNENDWPDFNGSGYIAYIGYIENKELKTLYNNFYRNQTNNSPDINGITVYKFSRYTADRERFEEVPMQRYHTLYHRPEANDDIVWPQTQWEQKLAATPSGKETVTIPKGTAIYFGLYDLSGWIEVLNPEEQTLGWMDLSKVDLNEYTDNYYEDQCED